MKVHYNTVDCVSFISIDTHLIFSLFKTCYTTVNPEWEEAFTFFIQDPRKQDIDIQVAAQKISYTALNVVFGILKNERVVVLIWLYFMLIKPGEGC